MESFLPPLRASSRLEHRQARQTPFATFLEQAARCFPAEALITFNLVSHAQQTAFDWMKYAAGFTLREKTKTALHYELQPQTSQFLHQPHEKCNQLKDSCKLTHVQAWRKIQYFFHSNGDKRSWYWFHSPAFQRTNTVNTQHKRYILLQPVIRRRITPI